jgi:hypothetical protein
MGEQLTLFLDALLCCGSCFPIIVGVTLNECVDWKS